MCRPPVRTEWIQDAISVGTAVSIRVPRSDTLHRLTDGRVVVRRGAENAVLEDDAIDQQLVARPAGEFELQAVGGATRSDLAEDVIDEYMEQRQRRNPRSTILPKDKLLQQIGALTPGKTPTISGLLLFGQEPQIFMPHSRAIFVKFSDTTPRGAGGALGYGRREEILGPLPQIIEHTWRIIWEEMDKSAVVTALSRNDIFEYPKIPVREALINAVAHRDYRMTGSSIEVRMYTDRLEVISPGGLPAHITVDNIVEEHYSRNPRIVNGLHQWGFIEEMGLGVDRMIEDMVNAGHQPPLFDAKPHSFKVTLFNKKDPKRVVQAWEQNMSERQMKAIEYLRRNGSITNSEYRELCPHVGQETVRLDLADLVAQGVLLKIGDKRGTRYILK
jgi:ATP-dependent DNA helicase RecG